MKGYLRNKSKKKTKIRNNKRSKRNRKRMRSKKIKFGGHINSNMLGSPLHPGISNHHLPLTYSNNNLNNTDFADAKLVNGLVKVKVY